MFTMNQDLNPHKHQDFQPTAAAASRPKSQPQLMRERLARALAERYYERGNQSRSYKYVWRCYALPTLGIGYRTFLRYVKGA